MSGRGLLVLLCAAGTTLASSAIERSIPAHPQEEPIDIRAAQLEYTNETLIASGGVTGRFENVTIRAERLTAVPESGDLRIEGNILFERDNVLWKGSSLDYNFKSQSGVFGPSLLEYDPVLLSVDHIERVSSNEFRLAGATFTTCPEECPHFRVYAEEARLIDEEVLTAKGVKVYLGNVPVFYWPFWRQELKKSIFTFRAGYASEWGAFGLIKATVPLAQGVDWISDFNLYSARGIGLGQGFEWERPSARGRVGFFYLRDLDHKANADDYVGFEIDENRTRFVLEHLQYFDDAFYLNTKWNHLSDPAVFQDFFKSEFRRNTQPENYGSLLKANAYGGSELFVSARLNDYYNNIDRYEIASDLYRTRLGPLPLYFQSENAAAHLEKVYAETNLTAEAVNAVRLDSDNMLVLPARIGFVNVVPRAGMRATYYSEADTPGGGDELRLLPQAGVEVSFQAGRVLSEKRRWYGDGLRHKIEPYADYIYQDTSLSTNRLHRFDLIDALSDENKVKLGLRNILQTKRDGKLSRFIDLDLYTYHHTDNAEAREDFDDLFVDARMPLTENTLVDLEGRYDWYGSSVPVFNTRVIHNRDDVTYSLEHLYLRGDRSLWTARVDLYPEEDVSFEAYGRYDDNSNDLQEVGLFGYMNRCCLRYGLGYRFYNDNEHTVLFSIGLSAYPETSISSGF